MMSLLSVFQWCEGSALGSTIRESLWLFPMVEAFHLVAFAIVGGAVLLVDLRLAGLALRDHSVTELAAETRPWLVGAVAVMIVSGTLLFFSEATKCYYSNPFWIKMGSLALAIIFALTIRRRQVWTTDLTDSGGRGKLVAAVSFSLWALVAWGGRWIGFSG
jgi:hypothetical protein